MTGLSPQDLTLVLRMIALAFWMMRYAHRALTTHLKTTLRSTSGL